MPGHLTIFYNGGSDQPAPWGWAVKGEPLQCGSSPLTEISARVKSPESITLVVPGDEVLSARVELPAGGRSKVLQALPYLIEERVVGDVERLHIVPQLTSDTVTATVASDDGMACWLSWVAESGLMIDRVIPEPYLLPPPQADHWHLALLGERLWLRSGDQALSTRWQLAPFLLEKCLKQAIDQRPGQIRLWHDGCRSQEEITTHLISALPGLPIEFILLTPSHPAALPGTAQDSGINLLQGPYARRRRGASLAASWWPAAILMLLWAAIQFGGSLLVVQRLESSIAELNRGISDTYMSLFPETRRLVNPRAQMEHQLSLLTSEGREGKSDFLTLLAVAGNQVNQFSSVTIERISYRKGVLHLELTADSLDTLNRVKNSLLATGRVGVEIGNTSAETLGVKSRLTIEGVGE